MTDQELNERVAKARGWKKRGEDWWSPPEGGLGDPLPKWSTEIAAAWELVPLISRFCLINDHREDGCSVEFEVGEEMDIAVGETAPRAICNAYLVVHGETE